MRSPRSNLPPASCVVSRGTQISDLDNRLMFIVFQITTQNDYGHFDITENYFICPSCQSKPSIRTERENSIYVGIFLSEVLSGRCATADVKWMSGKVDG